MSLKCYKTIEPKVCKILLKWILIATAAGLATGLGAIPVLIFKEIPDKVHDALLGFAAGVMLTAAYFSLMLPALDQGGLWTTVAGVGVAALFVFLIEKTIPHMHPHFGGSDAFDPSLEKGLLMAVAVSLHNFPEGLAVGVGLASGEGNLGILLAIAIAAQNIPEGLAVAAPMANSGLSRTKVFGLTLISGLAEPIAAVIGITLAGFSETVLPFALAFAAGAMFYVVSDQLIPDCHSKGNETEATFGIIAGILMMLILQELLG